MNRFNKPYQHISRLLQYLFLLILCTCSNPLKAQQEQRYNRFQYHKYKWEALHTKDFHIYFPAGNDSLCFFIAAKTPIAIEKIKKRMITGEIKEPNIIIYPSIDRQYETNIGSYENRQYSLPTFVSKGNRNVINYNGSYTELEQDLCESLARSAWEEQLKDDETGAEEPKGTQQTQTKKTKNENIPAWFKEGAIRYFAHGWTIAAEDKLRKSFEQNHFSGWQQVQAYEPKLSGHAFCYFLTEKYYPTAVAQTLIQLKKKKSLPRVIRLITKHNLDSLYTQCLHYYKKRFREDTAEHKNHNSTSVIPHKKGIIQNLLISPAGDYIAYVSLYSNTRTAWVYNTQSKETRKIATYKLAPWLDEHSSDQYPLLAWQPDGKQLFVSMPIKGKLQISRYTTEGVPAETITLYGTDGIKNIQPLSGNTFLLSAYRKGQSDIVQYDEQKEHYTPYTNDIYDDAEPIKDSKGTILFVSNRPLHGKKYYYDYGYNYDKDSLWQGIYKIQDQKLIPLAIDTLSYIQWDKPIPLSDGKLLAATTKYGSGQFALLNPNGALTQALGHYEAIQYLPQSDKIITYQSGKDSIYISEKPLESWIHENKTSLSDTISPWLGDYKIRQARQAKEDSLLNAARDTTHSFLEQVLSPLSKDKPVKENKRKKRKTTTANPQGISPYILQLHSAYFTAKINNDYFINRYQPYQAYQGQFKFPEIGGMAQGGMSDLFENHHFTIAYRLPAATDGSDFFIRYENTAGKTDWGLSYFRKVESLQPDPKRNWTNANGEPYPNAAKVKTHYYEIFLKDPLSYDCSVGFQAALRYDRTIFLATDKRSLDFEDYTSPWWVSTLTFTLNKLQPTLPFLYKGFYIKAITDVFKGFSQTEPIVSGTSLNISYHKPLYKYITLVAQLHAGYSAGDQKVLYNLGGMDNNVTPRVDSNVHFPQNAPYAFQTLVTPFRGYYQNTLYGNQYTLANADIYFPLFQALVPLETPLPAINKLQLGILGDIGNAKETWNNKPDNAKWLWSYGLSARTSLAGYPLRIDIAWPGNLSRQPVWYFTLKL